MISKILTGLAASTLAIAPVAATAATPASKLSIAGAARAGAPVTNAQKASSAGVVPAILAALIVAGGVWLVVDDNDDSDSN